MEVILAKSAGFCYGVARAVSTVYNNIQKERPIVTYGPITHNGTILRDLEAKNVFSVEDINKVNKDTKVFIRAHGVCPAVYESLQERNIEYEDCTCKDVKKIHNCVSERYKLGDTIIIVGEKEHPEIIGINGYGNNECIIIKTEEEAEAFSPDDKNYSVVVQTTFKRTVFLKIAEILKKKTDRITVFDTICEATERRQKEAEEIAAKVDYMIVLGDKRSSNTTKLYDNCKNICKNTFFIESIEEIELNIFSTNDKIGITAGASTPPAIIKEAVKTMSELDNTKDNQTFEEMLNESFVTLHTGDVVKGTVIQVANGEVSVNLGFKSDGIITRSEFSDDPNVNPAELVKAGDEIEVFVVRVNDGEGNVLLSKKRLEVQKGYAEIEQAFNDKTVVNGKIIEVVKGGLIALIKGIRVFVPSSQISSRFVDNLEKFKGQEFDFTILEFDRSKRRIVGGRKELAIAEEKAKKQKLFESIEEGQRVEGTVSRLVDFGAFVDLGGVDGLIHISEMSWGRVKKASDVLKEGDQVTVTVLSVDKEKEKISLSLKDINQNPWNSVETKYPIGEIVEGKVVRMVPFGAFIELETGVDGLVHISQIAAKHVVKPEDELTIGETISVKVMEIDTENKKISLSKKEADGVSEEVPAEEAETVVEIETEEISE